ncbi:MAG: mechanosensitive ion channel [Bacteroidota bacterium]|nr:mechanosensitive ion channel [Bacteroidota bacterium]
MRRLFIFYSLLFLGMGCFGQSNAALVSPSSNLPVSQKVTKDSLKTKAGPAKRMHKKIIMSLDTLTLSDYTLSIERVNDNLNSIGDSAKLGYDVKNINHRIDAMTKEVKQIRLSMKGRQTGIHLKNLYLYQSFTSKLDDETDLIQAQLNHIYHRVYHAKQHLKKVLSDSVFRKLYADKELRTTFDDKLIRLEWKWNRTDSVTKANVDTLNAMKVRLSDNGLDLANMLSMMDKRLDRTVPKLFGPEVNCLWEPERKDTIPQKTDRKTISIISAEQKAISFYIDQTWGERGIVFVLAIVLFLWLFLKRKLLKTLRVQKDSYDYLHLQYLNAHPLSSLIVLLLCLMPFFDAYAPTSYISIEYILLLLASTLIFFKTCHRTFLFNWVALVILFVADIVAHFLIDPTFIERLLLLAIQAGIIFFSVRLYRRLTKETPFYGLLKPAFLIGILSASLGIIYNLFGRFSLSGMLGIAAIFAVTQALVLTIFIQVIIEIILIQLQSSRTKKGVTKPFDTMVVIGKIKMPLLIIAVIVWCTMFTSNLNVYHYISNVIVNALTCTRTIGSISFQLTSVILFFVIIWFAHILQRLLSFLFGETGSEAEDLTMESKGQHSRLMILRLLVLIGGYLLAIAASGLPIDKLTFLLGALGVGIGMGLQNIVNNFVSGIILIFDGSLQIGDEIEVSGQAGKVKELGLRASTLSTPDGAEVIIPNGNILSQNIVNWTFSNDEKRVILTFSLSGKELDANVMNEVINDTIKNIPNVISRKKPVILYTKVTPESCTITVRFWSTISHFDLVKSEAMQQLSAAFQAKKIGFE